MRAFVFLFVFFSFSVSFAASYESFGVVPFISIGKSLNQKFDLNFYHSDTFNLTQREFQKKEFKSRVQQFYFQTSLGYKLLPDINLALGHIYQRNNPLDVDFSNEHRLFEQVTFSQHFDEKQVTHRFRFEQRFIDEREKTEFKTRLRYQLGANFPLQGRQLDPGEWYFNCYNEFYFSTTGERNTFFSDDWIYAGAGYQTTDWGKFEIGPLAQIGTVNEDKDLRYFYTLQLGWILKL